MLRIISIGLTFLLTFTIISAGAPMKIKVAIGQLRCIDSDVDGNLIRIEKQVNEASGEGAKAVFFPETALIGWVNPDAHRLAEPIPGKYTELIGNIARKYNVLIGIGLCEKDGDIIHDSAVLIDNSGKILLKHRKISILSHLMDKPYVPGRKEDISAADTPIGKIGMIICADTFIDEHLEILKEKKPDLVYIPYGWAATKDMWPEHGFNLVKLVQKAAMKIGAPVIGSDVVGEITHGPWTGRTYGGLSIAVDGDGVLLVQGKFAKEDLIVFDVEVGGE
ncbi:carbon-nitrogen hydrolase family protein [candidate division KSB1 bacterium]